MADPVEALILDLLEWIGPEPRAYAEVIEAWRTSCPRLPVWEDGTARGLVETYSSDGRLLVRATSAGLALLEEKRPHAYEELRGRRAPTGSDTA